MFIFSHTSVASLGERVLKRLEVSGGNASRLAQRRWCHACHQCRRRCVCRQGKGKSGSVWATILGPEKVAETKARLTNYLTNFFGSFSRALFVAHSATFLIFSNCYKRLLLGRCIRCYFWILLLDILYFLLIFTRHSQDTWGTSPNRAWTRCRRSDLIQKPLGLDPLSDTSVLTRGRHWSSYSTLFLPVLYISKEYFFCYISIYIYI